MDRRTPAGIACGRCGASYTRPSWSRLAHVETLTAGHVTRHLQSWPEDSVIEIRACAACGRSMARRCETMREGSVQ
jgi:Zn ribbon nucleic-acid-binding protein